MMAVVMEFANIVWIFVAVAFLGSGCYAQLGLFNILGGGNNGGNQPFGRSYQQPNSAFYPRPANNVRPGSNNVNLLSLFPQNNQPAKTQLDPKTKETLEDQKEKLEDILSKLQDLNKQKESNQEATSTTTARTTNHFNWINNKPTTKPIESTTKKSSISSSTERPKLKAWKKLNSSKVFFQVQPVVPENDSNDSNIVVYYKD